MKCKICNEQIEFDNYLFSASVMEVMFDEYNAHIHCAKAFNCMSEANRKAWIDRWLKGLPGGI